MILALQEWPFPAFAVGPASETSFDWCPRLPIVFLSTDGGLSKHFFVVKSGRTRC